MPLSHIISKFQNYTFNQDKHISSYLTELKNAGTLDENNLLIEEYLLPEILILTKKSILNRMSADLLFINNYWSWGFVSLYYSNFFSAQALNRLKGNFYTRVSNSMKKIEYADNVYRLLSASGGDTHKQEFIKLRENYLFLMTNNKYKSSIPDDYQNRPFYNESKVRNDVNYGLEHYNEFEKQITSGFTTNEFLEKYNNNDFEREEFKLLEKNLSRLKLLIDILNKIKDTNTTFELPYETFINNFKVNSKYKFQNEIFKFFEHKYNGNKQFHCVSPVLINEIKEMTNEI